ncbi:hypothetical protein ACNKHT_02035 [Shigella flexneri]
MLEQMGIAAKQASYKLAQLSSREKNRVLEKIADELEHKAKSSSTLTPRMLLTRVPMALAKRCLTVWH